MFMNHTENIMQLTPQRITYSRNALMEMRRHAIPQINIPSDMCIRRLEFDSDGRVGLPAFFVDPTADINDNEVRYGSLESETLER
jgi:hypothetical protein